MVAGGEPCQGLLPWGVPMAKGDAEHVLSGGVGRSTCFEAFLRGGVARSGAAELPAGSRRTCF